MRTQKTVNLIGVYLLVWFIGLVFVASVVYITHPEISTTQKLIYLSCAGGLGGVIYSIRGYYKHIFDKNFRKDVFWWYVFRPFISVITGIFSYFIIVGGLLVINKDIGMNYQENTTFFLSIAFLAGFSFTEFCNRLQKLSKKIFVMEVREK